MKIIMLGAPGAGKGTQASRLAATYHIPHISTGDIFRENIKNGTELGRKASEFIDQGLLVPDEIVVDIVDDRLKANDCEKGFILDGFPRTIPQANELDSRTDIDYVIDVEVQDEIIIKRMAGRRVCPKCGEPYHVDYKLPKVNNVCDKCLTELIIREDDKPETVQKRLAVYHEQTKPLIEHYKAQGKLKMIDGTQPMEKVTEDIVKAMGDVN